MKFDLELENEVGCIAITLNRDFVEGEMEAIVSMAKSLLKSKMTREDALAWAKKGGDAPSVLAWGGITTYYELEFHNPSEKILAIKAVKLCLGCGLKEAKDIVEGVMKCPPLSVHNATKVREMLASYGIKEYLLKEIAV